MSVLPTKYVPIDFSILGIAAFLMHAMKPNDTVSTLWDRVSDDSQIRTFDRYAAALTLLYACSLISVDAGILRKASRSGESRDY